MVSKYQNKRTINSHIFKQIDEKKAIFYAWFEAMHTRIDIALCNLSETDLATLTEKLKSEIERIEKMTDRFNPKSEVSLINQFAGSNPLKISTELYSIIENCIQYNKKTNGAFDITVNSKNNYQNGICQIVLHPKGKTIFFENENVQIDLCGYIKGYALDKIKEILLENNCTDALISLGNSSILALGNHPNGKGWKVNCPDKKDETVTLHNECLTSSGNTSRHIHIINPKTGKLVKNLQTTSVITKSGVEGEVKSLAAFLKNQ